MKISIRIFDDREVRALCDEQNAKWWFSVVDVVGILNQEADYTKVRNYWKYLKAKLKKEKIELVSTTNQLQCCVDWSKISKSNYMNAMIISTVDSCELLKWIKFAITNNIHSREMFMKGIDYSYYYEEN